MFYCKVNFQIEEDDPGAILIDDDTREGCIKKMAEFVRNVLGGRDGKGIWRGAQGITRCLFNAHTAGYNVCIASPKFDVPAGHFDGAVRVGHISRYWSDGGDDEFEVFIYDGEKGERVIDCLDVRYGGPLYVKDERRPDFVACADKIDARAAVAANAKTV